MQIVQNKALQLKVKDPQRILSVIPKSAVLHQGEKVSHVLVKWGLDEARVLANLGVKNVPSPIVGQYHWPGMYKPFAHQRETAAFLTMNPRAYCFNEQGCFDASTEYLTPTGWKRFDAYTDGDQVAQYHPDTGAIEFVDPIEYVKLPCQLMIHFKGPGIDQLLSPEHRVLLYRDGHGHYVESAAMVALRHMTGDSIGEDLVHTAEGEFVPILGDKSTITLHPAPDGFKYCFMVPSTFLWVRRNGHEFASGNTGKTLATAWAADYLMKLRMVKRVLIICPVSTMQSAWQADLFKSLMHRTVGVAYGDKRKRAEVINSNAEFVIINPDGVGVVARELRQAKFDLIVIDEATCIKNANTTRWKNINSLVTPATWLWMLTGTPASQSPLDAYGLARMMNPRTAPRSFTAWRDEVMYKATLFKWTPKNGWKERVFQLLQPAIRFTKDECLDLPPKTYVTRDVPLSKSQQDAYEKLRTQLAIHTAGETITAVNAAAGMSKLLQCSAGAVYSDGKETVDFDITPRYKVLLDIIDETDHKVLVFVPFTNTVDRITEMLNADGIPTEFIDGRVAAGKRNDIIQRFQLQSDTRVLVLQPQAVSHGITLHAANVSVWWGPVASQETYAQANDRMHRAGQKNPCTVINLQGSQAERIRYRALQSMANDQHELLSMYKEMLDS